MSKEDSKEEKKHSRIKDLLDRKIFHIAESKNYFTFYLRKSRRPVSFLRVKKDNLPRLLGDLIKLMHNHDSEKYIATFNKALLEDLIVETPKTKTMKTKKSIPEPEDTQNSKDSTDPSFVIAVDTCPPLSSSDHGYPGQMTWDGIYLYIHDDLEWKRVELQRF